MGPGALVAGGERPVAPARRVSRREARAIAYLLQVLGTRKDDGPVQIQVHRSNSETMVLVHGVEEPLGFEQQDLVDMVVGVVPSLKAEIKGSTRTIRVVPGTFHRGLAMVGARTRGLGGHPMEEPVMMSNEVDEVLV